jgi:hypothetical protein
VHKSKVVNRIADDARPLTHLFLCIFLSCRDFPHSTQQMSSTSKYSPRETRSSAKKKRTGIQTTPSQLETAPPTRTVDTRSSAKRPSSTARGTSLLVTSAKKVRFDKQSIVCRAGHEASLTYVPFFLNENKGWSY